MNKASGKELSAILNFQSVSRIPSLGNVGPDAPQYLQLDFTLGPAVTTNPYHINVVRSPMTRNIGPQFEDMHEEAVDAFKDIIKPARGEWTAIPIFASVAEVVSRINARLAVGFPLCESLFFTHWIAQLFIKVRPRRGISPADGLLEHGPHAGPAPALLPEVSAPVIHAHAYSYI